jgi:hypothetical protein
MRMWMVDPAVMCRKHLPARCGAASVSPVSYAPGSWTLAGCKRATTP